MRIQCRCSTRKHATGAHHQVPEQHRRDSAVQLDLELRDRELSSADGDQWISLLLQPAFRKLPARRHPCRELPGDQQLRFGELLIHDSSEPQQQPAADHPMFDEHHRHRSMQYQLCLRQLSIALRRQRLPVGLHAAARLLLPDWNHDGGLPRDE